jgi:hypothetical protein
MLRRTLAAAVILVALAALAVAPEASATIEGPCTAEIAGQDVGGRSVGATSDAIEVTRDLPVSVTMGSERPIQRLKVEIEFSGIRWTVHERPSTGTSWASEVPVDDYAIYGLGLYKVVGSSVGQGFTCSGAALIEVVGDHPLDPLSTFAGIGGLALALIGALGVLAVAAKVGRSGVSPIFGAFLGELLGLGVVVLLQQFSVLYPTLAVTAALLAIGAVLGGLLSLFGLPTREGDAR